ncbi:MAG: hypothetical protein ABI663_14300 [Chryseolinea sp.]
MKMKSFILAIAVLLSVSSCDNSIEANIKDGAYSGTFYRSNPGVKYTTAKVSITLKDNTFEGGSDTNRYPTICKGTYKISGEEIEFTNSCGPWTADFDWSLIISGKFQITTEGDKVRLTRNYDGGFYDRYELKMQ